MTKVLIVTADVLREKMAGPAIRAWEMAREISQKHEVRLVSTSESTADRTSALFEVHSAPGQNQLREHTDWCDVLVFQGLLLSSHPWVADEDIRIVADLYDPMHLEQLEQTQGLRIASRDKLVSLTSDALDVQIRRADYMMCASAKQRMFWLGQLAANGRINPYTYQGDGMFERLLGIVPFGIDPQAPVQNQHGIKGVVPGIALDDEVLIWGGGIYNWFDPLTLVRAMALVAKERPKARLFFMGSGHPNPDVPQMSVAAEAYELAISMGLLGKSVFFNEGWVPYEERANYLLDADIGVSTHHLHVETEFSFRTRILDYLWAGLPMVATEGDGFAEIIEETNLGRVVPAGEVEALAEAIIEILSEDRIREEMAQNVKETASAFTWPTVLQPLVAYCGNPSQAADLAAGRAPITHSEREVRALRLQVDSIERSVSWRVFHPLRRQYGKWRTRLGLNPTSAQLNDYLDSVGLGDPSAEDFLDYLRNQRAE